MRDGRVPALDCCGDPADYYSALPFSTPLSIDPPVCAYEELLNPSMSHSYYIVKAFIGGLP